MTELPERDNEESERIRVFISWLNGSKPYPAPIQIIRYVPNLSGFIDFLKITGCGSHMENPSIFKILKKPLLVQN